MQTQLNPIKLKPGLGAVYAIRPRNNQTYSTAPGACTRRGENKVNKPRAGLSLRSRGELAVARQHAARGPAPVTECPIISKRCTGREGGKGKEMETKGGEGVTIKGEERKWMEGS